MLRDLRQAVRALSGARAFTITAVLALALAVGANGAIFGLVDALWLRPPGVRSDGTLVRVFATAPTERDGPWSWPEFQDVKARVTTLEDVAVRGRRGAVLTAADGSQELLLVNVVSTNFFVMLGVKPSAGRLFAPGDESSLEASPAVVLGYAFWQNSFGGDPGVIGRTLQLGRGRPATVTVMGVLPSSFRDLEAAADRDLWMPPETWIRIGGDASEFEDRDNRWFDMIGRRSTAVALGAVNSEAAAIAATFAADYPASSAGRTARVVDDLDYRLEHGGVAAHAMLGLVLLVVLITCVNIANLLFARSAARAQDLAIRLSLGAPRWRIMRELAAESIILGALGAIGGVIIAAWLIRLLPALMSSPPGMRAMVAFQTDLRVVLFTATVAGLTTLLFGLAPAWLAARADLVSVIKHAAGASAAGGSIKRGLVVAQIAISLVLLCVAAALTRSFIAIERADIGFARTPVLTLWTTFGNEAHETTAEAIRQLEALPEVQRVAVAIRAPLSLSGGGMVRPVVVPGVPTDSVDGLPQVKFNAVSPEYFDVMGTRILRGRPLSGERGAPTVVVNEQFARQFFAGRDPIGAIIEVADVKHRIVGIAQDGIVNEVGERPQPYMYLPFDDGRYGETTFLLAIRGDAGGIASAARSKLRALDSRLEPRRMVTMAQYVAYATSLHRTTAALASILGFVGLVLTAVGVYGVVAYRTSRRTKEIGIRVALGAVAWQVQGMVIRDGLTLAFLGVMVGLPLALGGTQLVASMLVGVETWDPLSFAGAAAILLLAIALATLVPARRATRIEPARALR